MQYMPGTISARSSIEKSREGSPQVRSTNRWNLLQTHGIGRVKSQWQQQHVARIGF